MSQDPTALQVTVLLLQADTHSDHAKLQEKIGGCYPPNCVYHRPWMETGETEKGRGSQDEGVRAKMRPSVEDPKRLVSIRNQEPRKSSNLVRGVFREHPSSCHTPTS